MNKILKLTAAALVAVFFANSSSADNEGISIGVWGATMDIDTVGKETQPAGTTENEPDVVSASISKSVDVGSVFIEYTAAQGSSIGFEYYPGDATIGTGSRTDNCSCQGDSATDSDGVGTTSATYTAQADVTDVATIYIEPTIMVNDVFGVYAKAGITTMHVISLEGLDNGTVSSTYADDDIWGGMYGLGLKARHSSGMFLKLEGTMTHFRPFEVSSNSGNAGTIHADIEIEQVRLAVGYTF